MRDRTEIVKVMRVLSSETPNLAQIYCRGSNGCVRKLRAQHLSPDQDRELGRDLFGYFTAEDIGDTWFLRKRIANVGF